MKKVKHKTWQLLLPPKTDEYEGKELFNKVNIGDYQVTEVLKDTFRSQVKRIVIDGKDLVLKIPNEKNTRNWIRFLTWFRVGEAFKNIKGMQLLREKDILTTEPILAAEKRNAGMVVDSWLLYEYLEGNACVDIPASHAGVVKVLAKIHRENLLHGDPQIRNFIKKGEKIYTIDSNPKTPGFTGFDKGYEWAYLRKSYPGIEKFFGQILNTFWYKFAYKFDLYDRALSKFRKRIKQHIGLKR